MICNFRNNFTHIIIYFATLFVMFIIYTSFAFADMPFFHNGARPEGIGGAFTAVADDENAIFHNPAGLAYINKNILTLSTSYRDYKIRAIYDEIFNFHDNQIFFNCIKSTHYFTFGIGGGIRRKGDNESKIWTRSDIENPPRILYWKDTEEICIVSMGKKLIPELAGGISLKYMREEGEIFEEIFEALKKEREYLDLDIGVIKELNDKISIGLLLENLLKSKVDYIIYDYFLGIAVPERLSRNLNIGISIKPTTNILIAIDIDNFLEDKTYDKNHEEDYIFKRRYQIGTEIKYNNFFIRAGIGRSRQINKYPVTVREDFKYDKTTVYAIGLGFRNNNLKIDFAINYDKREDEIEKHKTLEVKNPTFRYLLSSTVVFN